MGRRTPLDEQLDQIRQRREQAVDLLVRSLIEIDTCTSRIDVLLDRRRGDVRDHDQMT